MATTRDVTGPATEAAPATGAAPATAPATRRRWVLLVAALFVALVGSACQDGQLPRVSGEAAPELGAAVDLLVLQHLEDKDVPGATVAVTKDGRLVLSKGYGYADLDTELQMEPWHRTRIGSVSKLPTTIAALQLVERGDLDLDGHLYGSSATPIWGTDPDGTPGVIHTDDAVLQDAGTYLTALVTAAETLGPPPGGLVDASTPGYLLQGTRQGKITEILDWASRIQVRHVLSHTAGYLNSGSLPKAAQWLTDQGEHDKDEDGLTYPELHEAMMAGANGPPLRFEAGTRRAYSNHGFGLMGQLIAEITDESYVDHTQANVFHPLGLEHVAPRDLVGVVGERDATSYAANKKGEPVPPLKKYQEERTEPTISTSTGSWTATAQDVARTVCALDEGSNGVRPLHRDTVDVMHTVAFPEADSRQPLGWDLRTGTPGLTKDGSTPRGGGARVTKYLPGSEFGAEINVVVNTNKQGSPPIGLLRDIAKVVDAADIADDYDLFDPAHRCVGPPPSIEILPSGTEFRLGEEIMLEAVATDFAGGALPVTWHLPDGTDVEASPSPWDGRVSLFLDDLAVGTHTIGATTTDGGGHTASDQVVVEVTYDPPTVVIVAPQDGAHVEAGTDLVLVGQSTMGTYFTLPDEKVAWDVRRDDQVVHAGTGHHVVVPGQVLQPGGHTITFTGHDGVDAASQSIDVFVTSAPGGPATPGPSNPGGPPDPGGPSNPGGPPDPGGPSNPGTPPGTPPVVTIRQPTEGATIATQTGGGPVEVGFAGAATDANGDPVDGTRLRWTARKAGDDEPTVLCEGGGFPDEPADEADAADCATFTAELAPDPVIGGVGTLFVIVLEARDADGVVGEDQRIVHVVVPPAG